MEISNLFYLDRKTFCKEIMKRPGMYVGSARLDYIQHFLSGFQLSKISGDSQSNNVWNENYEMQYWLMAKQSVCIRSMCTLNGWTLFYRCFGSGTAALMYFSKYLHDEIPEPVGADKLAYHEICVAYDVYTLAKKFRSELKKDFQTYKRSIILIIRNLIEKTTTEYDDVRVYIYRNTYFSQIRFVFHTLDGWQDDTNDIERPSNYQQLIELHAYVECVDDKDLINLSEYSDRLYFYPNYKEEFNNYNVSDMGHIMPDEISLHCKYQKWKEHFTHTY